VEQQLFREVIGHFASGVTIITTREQETNYGLTASAVTSLTLEPPMLLVCINKNTGTQAVISRNRTFAVNILDVNQTELALQFARPSADKFQGVEYAYGSLGAPLLAGALAHLECRVAADVSAGTHTVFLAEVEQGEAHIGSPLTYFRGTFGRFEFVRDEEAYHEIREYVLGRDLDIAEALDMQMLGSRFNAAHSSVIYALTKLVAEGLVQRDLVKGYIIAPLDLKTSDDAFDARCTIETGAAELTVGHLSTQELATLRERMEATLPFIAGNHFVDFAHYIETNAAFHEYIVSRVKSSALLDVYRRLSIEGIMWRAIWRTLPNFDHAHDELTLGHQRIVEAYEQGNVQLAISEIQRHNEQSKRTNRLAIEAAGGRI
jgi:flavin reductase (DIM6/NTAB) family NADH-FMN oxidoreductase RutF/DNA-binding GntR family transcriptional regulator